MKRIAFVLTLVVVGSLMTGYMTKAKAQAVAPTIPTKLVHGVAGVAGGTEASFMELSAVVTAIDKEKRTATLKGPEGNSVTVHVGPEAVNFDQVAVGDMINVEIVQEVTAFVAEAGSDLTDAATVTTVRAEKGEQPGGVVVETVQMVATIIDLDVWSRVVELQFEDGTIRAHSVRPDVIMEGYEVGDQVVIQVTEMIAVDITKK